MPNTNITSMTVFRDMQRTCITGLQFLPFPRCSDFLPMWLEQNKNFFSMNESAFLGIAEYIWYVGINKLTDLLAILASRIGLIENHENRTPYLEYWIELRTNLSFQLYFYLSIRSEVYKVNIYFNKHVKIFHLGINFLIWKFLLMPSSLYWK